MRLVGYAALIALTAAGAAVAGGAGARGGALSRSSATADEAPLAEAAPAAALLPGRPGFLPRLPAGAEQLAQVVVGTPPDWNTVPYKWVGRLQFKSASGNTYLCSAQFIAPKVILTAGHCIKNYENNSFHSDFIFLLQYRNGSYSHRYRGLCASVPAGYSLPANYSSESAEQKETDRFAASQYDYGMILLNAPSATGYFRAWQGSWKAGDWHGATKIGYPGDLAAGEELQSAHGALLFADDIWGVDTWPQLLALWQFNPYLTQGMSGGGWVGSLSPVEAPGNNVLISLSSFDITSHPEMAFGPQFNTTVFNALLDHVASGGCLPH